jgi:hypothetical protein
MSAASIKKTTRRKSRAKVRKDWEAPPPLPPTEQLIGVYLADARAGKTGKERRGTRSCDNLRRAERLQRSIARSFLNGIA